MSTAILTDDFDAEHGADAHFSVVLEFNEGDASCDETHRVAASTLAADTIGEQFTNIGQRFLVMEGPRKVAVGEVTAGVGEPSRLGQRPLARSGD